MTSARPVVSRFPTSALSTLVLCAMAVLAQAGDAPDPFTFTAQTRMPLGASIVSNPITVTGIDTTTVISIGAVGEYAVSTDGGGTWGGWSSAPGTVGPGNQVEVRQTSPASNLTLTTATLTIGGVSANFDVTTAAADDPHASGLVAWWRAEDNAYDAVGGHHGTAQSGAIYAAGSVGRAFSLNGAGAYVTVPASSAWAFGTADFTIDFWLYTSTNDDRRPLVNNRQTPASNSMWAVEVYQVANRPEFHSGLTIYLTPTDLLVGSTWNHVAVTRNGTTLTMYVNGVLSGTVSNAGDFSEVNDLQIGRDVMNGNNLGGRTFQGLVDEVRIFDRALAAGEIDAILFADGFETGHTSR